MTTPGGQNIWCNTYVDDLFLGCNPGPLKDFIINHLFSTFEMKDLGALSTPLGMELEYNHELGTCTLHQAALIRDIISDNGLMESSPRLLPLDTNQKLVPTPATEEPIHKEECHCGQPTTSNEMHQA
jgi:hypothetical protein